MSLNSTYRFPNRYCHKLTRHFLTMTLRRRVKRPFNNTRAFCGTAFLCHSLKLPGRAHKHVQNHWRSTTVVPLIMPTSFKSHMYLTSSSSFSLYILVLSYKQSRNHWQLSLSPKSNSWFLLARIPWPRKPSKICPWTTYRHEKEILVNGLYPIYHKKKNLPSDIRFRLHDIDITLAKKSSNGEMIKVDKSNFLKKRRVNKVYVSPGK